MTENEINEVLAAELTKRSGEEYSIKRGDFGKDWFCKGVLWVGHCTFTESYDILHLLEKLLDSVDSEDYARGIEKRIKLESLPLPSGRGLEDAELIQDAYALSPLDRARVLAETLRGAK